MKKLVSIRRDHPRHWVGDGFPVQSIFGYNNLGREISPFILMDYAGPENFPPSDHIRGVGEHPHRGFETVTIVYDGEVEHRDSAGGGGLIRSGDVQWMTAASGLVHEEKHGRDFAKRGGRFEMVQLWVNLPAKDKSESPRYQGIKNETIPSIALSDKAGTVRVIAGEYEGKKGPAKTFTPINLWDVRLNEGHRVEPHVPAGQTCVVFVLDGEVRLSGGETVRSAELAVLEREGDVFSLEALKKTKLLFLGGQPINETMIGFGPFVMNTKAEIQQAFIDFEQGKMGKIGRIEGSE